MFEGKSFLVTGGTGSFGNKVLKRLLSFGVSKVTVLSRDEKKQYDMRASVRDSRVKFLIGDVRDIRSVDDAMRGVDFVFHAAALKQVPICENFPLQAANTNIFGASNVLRSASEHGVQRVIVLSTDKAVYPINAMGLSKAMMEKLMVAEALRNQDLGLNTITSGTRYGNVIASRGSVVPLFINQIKHGREITITDPTMTRFLMSLEEAVDLVIKSFCDAESGDIHVHKSPAATVATIAKALQRLIGVEKPVRIIGVRPGEKFHETLVSSEEMAVAQDIGKFYRVPLNGEVVNHEPVPYTSANTDRLTIDQVCDIFENTKEVRDLL